MRLITCMSILLLVGTTGLAQQPDSKPAESETKEAPAEKSVEKAAEKPAETAAPAEKPAEAPPPMVVDSTAAVEEPEIPAEESDRIGLVIAPKAGAIIPVSDLGATFFGALEVGYDFTFLGESLGMVVPGVAVEFSYSQPTLSGDDTAPETGAYSYDLSQRFMTLAIDALITFNLGSLRPYLGLGYGFYFLLAEVDSFGMTNEETQVRSGMQARAGLTYHLWKGGLFIEARYHYVGLEFLSTGDSDGSGITAAAGYRFAF